MFSIQGFLTWQSKLLMTYKHLSQAERYQIYVLMKAGRDQSQIAQAKIVLYPSEKEIVAARLVRSEINFPYLIIMVTKSQLPYSKQ